MKAFLYTAGQVPVAIPVQGLSLKPDADNTVAVGAFLNQPGFIMEIVDAADSYIAFCLTGPGGHFFGPPCWEAVAKLRELTGNQDLFPTPQEAARREMAGAEADDEWEYEPLSGPVLIITSH